ncbi:MAG: hypothetical protein HOO96_23745 [Polyangiaceae bacterium]|nr:hypothetical protein [Polyangiaceae bacterium]
MPRLRLGLIILFLVTGGCDTFSGATAPAIDAAVDAPASDEGGALPDAAIDGGGGAERTVVLIGGINGVAATNGYSGETYIGRVTATGIAWRTGPSLPNPAAYGCAFAAGPRVYLVGGSTTTTAPVLTQWLLPRDSNPAWAVDANLGTPRYGHACAVHESRVMVAGGIARENQAVLDTTEIGTLSTTGDIAWSAGPLLSRPVSNPGAAMVAGGMFLGGGLTVANGCDAQIRFANLPEGPARWNDLLTLDLCRSGSALAAVGKTVYVVGGRRNAGNELLRQVDVLTTNGASTPTLTNATQLTVPRAHAAAAVIGGRLYVFGGFTSPGLPTADVLSMEITGAGALGPPRTETPIPVALAAFAFADL